ncbi:MAG: hypothetical protein ACYSOI_05930 [Planctomycetota bacterium]|jgi:hypothetical protein
MIDIKVYNREGKELEDLQVDEALFGGTIRAALLKQAEWLMVQHARFIAKKGRGTLVPVRFERLFVWAAVEHLPK